MRRGPGYTPFPRRGVLRVGGLAPATVDVDRVRSALAARGVAEGRRDVPAGTAVRALVTVTRAGTVITLERRRAAFTTRRRVLRELARLWDSLAQELESDARTSDRTGSTRTSRSSGAA